MTAAQTCPSTSLNGLSCTLQADHAGVHMHLTDRSSTTWGWQPRPFRHLCPEADKRDAMTDAEFWDDVARSLNPRQFDPEQLSGWEPDFADADDAIGETCTTCGADGACGYDDEGRPMIHATEASA